jgi:dTDP-4-amino-4,6-dideoxygalactose transaminase
MPLLYFPPAASRIPFLKTCLGLVGSQSKNPLEKALTHFLSAKDVYCCRSWVGALALFLNELEKQEKKGEVILPRYSCYEFTLAIQMAGLTPVYMDIDQDGTMLLPEIKASIRPNTLAIIGVNNVGIYSDMASIATLTKENGICFIEDATYTLFGQYQGRLAGTVGDVAILNFSEGKAMPIGGGGVVLNNADYQAVFSRCKERVLPASSSWKSFGELLTYVIGSSILGYSAYRILKKATAIDFKEKMSMEVSRRTPTEKGNALSPHLMGAISPIKQGAIGIVHDAQQRQIMRNTIARKYDTVLEGHKRIRKLYAHEEGRYVIRYPILCETIDVAALQRHERLGISRLYGPDSPLNVKAAKETNSLYFYDHLLTLPVYDAIDDSHIRQIGLALKEITQ